MKYHNPILFDVNARPFDGVEMPYHKLLKELCHLDTKYKIVEDDSALMDFYSPDLVLQNKEMVI